MYISHINNTNRSSSSTKPKFCAVFALDFDDITTVLCSTPPSVGMFSGLDKVAADQVSYKYLRSYVWGLEGDWVQRYGLWKLEIG